MHFKLHINETFLTSLHISLWNQSSGLHLPDGCPACWVTKACTFICAYFPSPANLPSPLLSGTASSGGQKVLPFTAASWDNKGSYDIALKVLGTCKEKSMLKEYTALPAACPVPPSFLPCCSPQAGHWTWPLQSLLDLKSQTATYNAGTHSPLLPLLRGSPEQRRGTGRHLKICLL